MNARTNKGDEMKANARTLVLAAAGILAAGGATYVAANAMGCTEVGATDNQEQTGRQERGRDPGNFAIETYWDADKGQYVWMYQLLYSDVILSPDGKFVMAMVPVPGPDQGFAEPALVLAMAELPDGKVEVFPDIANLERINFSPDGATAYLLRDGGTFLSVMDLGTRELTTTVALTAPYSVVDVTADGSFLVLSNLPTTDGEELWYNADECHPGYLGGLPDDASLCTVAFLDTGTLEQWSLDLPMAVRDIDFSPLSDELLFTYSKWFGQTPVATVQFYDLASRKVVSKVDFQNCADELVIAAEKGLALLSPTTCSKDPISIIDLKTRSFVKTLPGFGPVVVARDGATAIGFTRKQDMEQQWSYSEQKTDFGLIVVDLATTDWKVMDHGDVAPAYTVSPDGRFLYLFHDTLEDQTDDLGKTTVVHHYTKLQQLDLENFAQTEIAADGMGLERFVWTDDGTQMYFLSGGKLFRIESGVPKANEIPLAFEPELMNIRPQGDFLVLGEWDAPVFHLVTLDAAHTATTKTLAIESR